MQGIESIMVVPCEQADVDRSKCLHVTSSKMLFCTQYVGNTIISEEKGWFKP